MFSRSLLTSWGNLVMSILLKGQGSICPDRKSHPSDSVGAVIGIQGRSERGFPKNVP